MFSRADTERRPEQLVEFFRENGFLVLEDGLTPAEVSAVHEETVSLCRGERGEMVNYDLPVEQLSDNELVSRVLCIHQPHHASEKLASYIAHPPVVDVLTRIIGPNVKCMQSMLFIKSSGKPGQAWHQDEDFIPTRDRSLCGAWMALDDANTTNGCLWIIPGSHKRGVLYPQYPHNDDRFDCAVESFDFPYTDDDAVAVEVPAGAVVFFNGYLLHRSLPNSAPEGTYRRALVNHYMSAESLLPWVYENGKPMAKQDYRGVVMVAGEDPYAYKGLTAGKKPHIRKSGKGGCGDGRMSLEEFKAAGMPKKAML
jgi:ectoine hydroxylase-related dioxygenase (phytanoyl-CoA dioxygenase family)